MCVCFMLSHHRKKHAIRFTLIFFSTIRAFIFHSWHSPLLSFYAERADVIDKVHKYDKNTCGKKRQKSYFLVNADSIIKPH